MAVDFKSENYFKLLIYLVVIILVNIAGVTLFFRIDLTENKIYSISKASKEVVRTLSEPLTINVFFTQNLPAPHNNTERYLRDLLEEYSISANKYFNYKFYDVSPEGDSANKEAAENSELAKNYGIHPVQIRIVEKDEVKFKKAYMGLVLIHGDIIEKIPTITSTDGLEYKLTTAIRKMNNKISALLALSDKIQIKLFLSSSLKIVAPFMRINNLEQLPDEIETIANKLNSKNYGKLAFEYLDPSTDNGLDEQIKKHTVMSLQWPALSNGKIPPGEGAIGLVLEHKNKAITLPLIQVLNIPLIGQHYQLTDTGDLEEIISESIESLIDINEDLGFLADHGSLTLSAPQMMGQPRQQGMDTLKNFQALVSENYSIREISLKEQDIPKSIKCLVIAGPKEQFTDYELFQIDQHLMQGNSLALFMETFNEVMPQQNNLYMYNQGPSYVPLNTGIEKLLSHYGISVKKSYVMDENCYKQSTPQQFGGGERKIYFAPIIKNEFINNDLAFMNNIKGLIALKISPVTIDQERISKNNLVARKIFSSSEKSWEMKDRINLNPMFMTPPKSDEEKKSITLAYLVEGEFPSYFTGKTIPIREKASEEGVQEKEGQPSEDKKPEDKEKDEKQSEIDKIKGEGDFISKGKPGKIFIIASSEILKDNLLDREGQSPNSTFLMNVLDSLNNHDATAAMRSKVQRFNPLAETEPGIKTLVKTFNIAGLPVIVVAFGLIVLFRRHARKKHIKMMFQK
jgi:ABC-2 type transport system permease protein